MPLDLSFLEAELGARTRPARPVNVYSILREGWRESRVDMTLLFFLDPAERHGLGSIVMDALLGLLDGAPVISAAGTPMEPFVAADHLGSTTWEVRTQVDFIDVYAVDRDRGVAVVVENKIGHVLENPLGVYAQTALNDPDVKSVLVVVLAPEMRPAPPGLEAWLSRSVTYDQFADAIRASPGLVEALLNPADIDQRRSLDLLQQFIEARSVAKEMHDTAGEAERIGQWRAVLHDHGDAILRFDEARQAAGRIVRERSKRLEPLIAAGFEQAGLTPSWEAHGGWRAEAWNAYQFPDVDWSVELKLTTDPAKPALFVYDYQGRTYSQPTTQPLGLEWAASDEEVADAFVASVVEILDLVRNGTRT